MEPSTSASVAVVPSGDLMTLTRNSMLAMDCYPPPGQMYRRHFTRRHNSIQPSAGRPLRCSRLANVTRKTDLFSDVIVLELIDAFEHQHDARAAGPAGIVAFPRRVDGVTGNATA